MEDKYEYFTRVLPEIMLKVKDKKTLLSLTCSLLQAKAAILINFQEDGDIDKGRIDEVYFQRNISKSELIPEILWDWIRDAWEQKSKGELLIEKELSIDDKCIFTGGLIVFGNPGIISRKRQLAMVVLQQGEHGEEDSGNRKPDFLSYHTWASMNLLRQYETMMLQQNNSIEIQQKENYWQYASEKVVPLETWKNINDRVKNAKRDDIPIYHGIWMFYSIFRYVSKKELDDPEKILEELQKAADNYSLRQKTQKELQSETTVFAGIVEWIFLSVRGERKHKELIAWLNSDEKLLLNIGKKDGNQLLKDQFLCHLLCWLWMGIGRKAAGYGVTSERRCCLGEEKKGEKALRFDFQRYLSLREEKIDILDLSNEVKLLMELSKKFFLNFLASERFQCGETRMSDWGREALRLYLATEISGSSPRMEQLYLDGEKTLEHRHAPERLRRHFILNLSRFMLSTVMICLDRLELSLAPGFRMISRPEELDSLLYIVDRYVHIELGVDKRLNVQELLGKQIAAEVHLHLASPYYRDHLLHVIDVFLLGHLILNTRIYWLGKEECPVVRHLSRIKSRIEIEDQCPVTQTVWFRNWAVASLLHDIGYQIGCGSHTSNDPMIWQKYFSLAAQDGPESLHLKKQAGLKDLNLDYCNQFISNLHQLINGMDGTAGTLLPIEMDLKDHGMLSALKVAQILLHSDNHNTHEGSLLSKELINEYTLAVHAISRHNFHSIKVSLKKNPIAILLRFCDELQEWDRRRVNVEKIIKGLYLDIQENAEENLPGHDLLQKFCANICFKRDTGDRVVLQLNEEERNRKKPTFSFRLQYKDAITAQFDPIMTLLGKSYCFQNLDLSLDSQKQNEIRMMVEMQFPVPAAYNGVFEYDIYGLFTEDARDLPLLEYAGDISGSDAGLIKLTDLVKSSDGEKEQKKYSECFGIVLQQKSEIRLGWLPVDPGHYRNRFTEFKNQYLTMMF